MTTTTVTSTPVAAKRHNSAASEASSPPTAPLATPEDVSGTSPILQADERSILRDTEASLLMSPLSVGSSLEESRSVVASTTILSPSRLMNASSRVFCRICHEGSSPGRDLISPCSCSGSVGALHKACLERWLSVRGNGSICCEICGFAYRVAKKEKSYLKWLCGRPFGDDHRNLVGDCICFLLLTPLAAISAYLCSVGAAYYFSGQHSEAIGLVFLATFLILVYLLWFTIALRFQVRAAREWRTNNPEVQLVEVSIIQRGGGTKRDTPIAVSVGRARRVERIEMQ